MKNSTDLHGLRPTPNRLLIVKELALSANPLSLTELESRLETIEKSSIFRVLTQLHRHGVVHTVEDGRGIVKYELCHSDEPGHCDPTYLHAHFYCVHCHNLTCITEILAPTPVLPDGYQTGSVNYVIKGICPSCNTYKRN